ncbi:MAG: hypothetical protein EOP10_00355 [Proteobacteria bacterium]|nr:MAG: hypothetical protein EOP10_00355 [Pseudomonadota bacterium]
MNLSRTLIALALATSTFLSSKGLAQQSLAEKDLAIALPLESKLLVPMKYSIKAENKALFPREWFDTLHGDYQQTSAGDVFETESPYEDWHIVSARLVPCQPLGQNPKQNITELCWPEIRLVWQAIQRKTILHAIYMEASADDRAIHAGYPVDPALVLSQAEAVEARSYLDEIAKGVREQANFSQLPASRMERFRTLRNRVSKQFLQDTLALRQLPAASYKAMGLRPESMDSEASEKAFTKAWEGFLQKYARSKALRSLTSFSLPEGREPAHLDEWIFLSYDAKDGRINQKPIELVSPQNNEVLFSSSHVQRGSMARDDDKFYDSANLQSLRANVLLFINDRRELMPVFADRAQTLVPNTSCASCHKLNDERFDFHNFSYLENRELTVSPRVLRDVELDLAWLATHSL